MNIEGKQNYLKEIKKKNMQESKNIFEGKQKYLKESKRKIIERKQ